MKRVFLASVALMALTGAAAAADLPPAPAPYYKAPYAAPYYNWTGFYLGVNGGGGFGTLDVGFDRQLQSHRCACRRHHRLQLPVRPCRHRRRRRH